MSAATYHQEKNTLSVLRDVTDKTTTNICSAQFMAEYQKAAMKIVADLKSQVLVRN